VDLDPHFKCASGLGSSDLKNADPMRIRIQIRNPVQNRIKYIFLSYRFTVPMTADRKRGRPAKKVAWSNLPPAAARKLPPIDIMTKEEELSPRAKAAVKLVELWSLFFTPEMTEKVVQYTNDKIRHRCEFDSNLSKLFLVLIFHHKF